VGCGRLAGGGAGACSHKSGERNGEATQSHGQGKVKRWGTKVTSPGGKRGCRGEENGSATIGNGLCKRGGS